eukprot:bmy_09725T0
MLLGVTRAQVWGPCGSVRVGSGSSVLVLTLPRTWWGRSAKLPLMRTHYDPQFGDAFWNSSKYGMVTYLLRMMTSWAIVCSVWYLPPMTREAEEDAVQFANRVKSAIARQGGLVDLLWPRAGFRGHRDEGAAASLAGFSGWERRGQPVGGTPGRGAGRQRGFSALASSPSPSLVRDGGLKREKVKDTFKEEQQKLTGAGPEPALPPGPLRPGRRRRGPPRAQASSGFFEPPGPLPGRAAALFLLRGVRGRSAIKVPSPPCPCGLSAGPEPAIPTRDPGCGLSPRPACGRGPHRARPAPRKAQARGPADSRRERVVCRGPRQTDGPRPRPLDLPLRPHSASSASAALLSPGLGGWWRHLPHRVAVAAHALPRGEDGQLGVAGPGRGRGGMRGAGAAHGAPALGDLGFPTQVPWDWRCVTAGGGRARQSGGEGGGSDKKIRGQGSSGGFGGWVPRGLHAAGGKPLAACASLWSPGGRSEARPPPPYGFKARLNSHPSGESCLSPNFSVCLSVRPSPLPALAEQPPHPSGFCSGRGEGQLSKPPSGFHNSGLVKLLWSLELSFGERHNVSESPQGGRRGLSAQTRPGQALGHHPSSALHDSTSPAVGTNAAVLWKPSGSINPAVSFLELTETSVVWGMALPAVPDDQSPRRGRSQPPALRPGRPDLISLVALALSGPTPGLGGQLHAHCLWTGSETTIPPSVLRCANPPLPQSICLSPMGKLINFALD